MAVPHRDLLSTLPLDIWSEVIPYLPWQAVSNLMQASPSVCNGVLRGATILAPLVDLPSSMKHMSHLISVITDSRLNNLKLLLLPRSLTNLEATSFSDDFDFSRLPQLVSLKLHIPSTIVLNRLPATLTEFKSHDSWKWDAANFALLPRTLRSLSIVSAMPVDDEDLWNLPPELEILRLQVPRLLCDLAIAALPRSLRSLTLRPTLLLLTESGTDALPPNLTYLSLPTAHNGPTMTAKILRPAQGLFGDIRENLHCGPPWPLTMPSIPSLTYLSLPELQYPTIESFASLSTQLLTLNVADIRGLRFSEHLAHLSNLTSLTIYELVRGDLPHLPYTLTKLSVIRPCAANHLPNDSDLTSLPQHLVSLAIHSKWSFMALCRLPQSIYHFVHNDTIFSYPLRDTIHGLKSSPPFFDNVVDLSILPLNFANGLHFLSSSKARTCQFPNIATFPDTLKLASWTGPLLKEIILDHSNVNRVVLPSQGPERLIITNATGSEPYLPIQPILIPQTLTDLHLGMQDASRLGRHDSPPLPDTITQLQINVLHPWYTPLPKSLKFLRLSTNDNKADTILFLLHLRSPLVQFYWSSNGLVQQNPSHSNPALSGDIVERLTVLVHAYNLWYLNHSFSPRKDVHERISSALSMICQGVETTRLSTSFILFSIIHTLASLQALSTPETPMRNGVQMEVDDMDLSLAYSIALPPVYATIKLLSILPSLTRSLDVGIVRIAKIIMSTAFSGTSSPYSSAYDPIKDDMYLIPHFTASPADMAVLADLQEASRREELPSHSKVKPQPFTSPLPPIKTLSPDFDDHQLSMVSPTETILAPTNEAMLTKNAIQFRLPPSLTVLQLMSNHQVDDSVIPYLPRTITRLALASSRITQACFKDLPIFLQDLLLRCDVDDAAVANLPRALSSLNLSSCISMGDDGVQNLPTKLTRFNLLLNNRITDLGILRLPRTLTHLNLYSNTKVTGSSLSDLPRGLLYLNLGSNNAINDSQLEDLPRNLLELLLLANTTITDLGLSSLPRTLTHLRLKANTNITDAGLAYLPAKLRSLHIPSSRVTGAGMPLAPHWLNEFSVPSTIQLLTFVFDHLPYLFYSQMAPWKDVI